MDGDDFSGKIALVTGASRGIGGATAKALAAQGAHVILLAKSQGALEEIDDDISASGGQSTILKMNLQRGEDVDKIGPTIAERFGALDIVVGNAGILGPLTPITHANPGDWDKVMAINVTANFRLVRSVDPLLRASGHGRAVFITSGMAQNNHPYWALYAASKAALNAAILTYAAENNDTSMRINLLSPGPVDTRMLGDAFPGGYQGEDMKKPEDVVDAILGLCSEHCTQHGEIIAL